jgi:hypothetical protein
MQAVAAQVKHVQQLAMLSRHHRGCGRQTVWGACTMYIPHVCLARMSCLQLLCCVLCCAQIDEVLSQAHGVSTNLVDQGKVFQSVTDKLGQVGGSGSSACLLGMQGRKAVRQEGCNMVMMLVLAACEGDAQQQLLQHQCTATDDLLCMCLYMLVRCHCASKDLSC